MPGVVLITGANRGIGLCILKRLLQAFPENKYILACRDVANGDESVEDLKKRNVLTSSHHVEVLQLDVSSTQSIVTAVEVIAGRYGVLDVLINNAGVAYDHSSLQQNDYNGLESLWQKTFMVNVFAPHILFEAAMDLLCQSNAPRVINISSGRASLTRSSTGALPPTSVLSYSASKVALNGLGVEMDKILFSKTSGRGRVWNASPGHCKTAFNGFRGQRDPLDGARVVEILLEGDVAGQPADSGFWEEENGELRRIPW